MAVSTGTAALVARAFGSGNYKRSFTGTVRLSMDWFTLSLIASLSMWFYGESIVHFWFLVPSQKNWLLFILSTPCCFSITFLLILFSARL